MLNVNQYAKVSKDVIERIRTDPDRGSFQSRARRHVVNMHKAGHLSYEQYQQTISIAAERQMFVALAIGERVAAGAAVPLDASAFGAIQSQSVEFYVENRISKGGLWNGSVSSPVIASP